MCGFVGMDKALLKAGLEVLYAQDTSESQSTSWYLQDAVRWSWDLFTAIETLARILSSITSVTLLTSLQRITGKEKTQITWPITLSYSQPHQCWQSHIPGLLSCWLSCTFGCFLLSWLMDSYLFYSASPIKIHHLKFSTKAFQCVTILSDLVPQNSQVAISFTICWW